MKVTVDTNVLVRAVIEDEPVQATLAAKLLRDATLVAATLPCLCEFVWVLGKVYGLESSAIALALRTLVSVANVEINRPAVRAGIGDARRGW